MPVTLTFDNGPSAGTTQRVLDILAGHGVQATFFVVGTALGQPGARAVATRAVQEGHWVGNHSMTHTIPLGADPDPIHAVREIDDAERIIAELAHERRFFRPFGGGGHIGPHLLSRPTVDRLCAAGYSCVLWNSVPRDWENPIGWVDAALADAGRLDHAVVVLHDLPTGAMDKLDGFLGRLEAEGLPVVQDFPDSVLVMDRGVAGDLDGLVSA